MVAGMLSRMAGGMHGKRGAGVPLGVRAGMDIRPEVARPWEFPTAVAPKDAHVEALVDGEWVQALLIEQRREGEKWVCRVAWADRAPGETRVTNQWVPADRVRARNQFGK